MHHKVEDFEVESCQDATKVDAIKNLQLATEPAIEPDDWHLLVPLFYV